MSCLSVHTPVVIVNLCLEFMNDIDGLAATHAANIFEYCFAVSLEEFDDGGPSILLTFPNTTVRYVGFVPKYTIMLVYPALKFS